MTQAQTLMLTVDEAAREIRKGKTWVWEAIRTGELTSVKIGRSRRIRRTDLEQYVASLPAEESTR